MNSEILYKPIAYQYRKPENKINKYTIIGERHSGTNWLERVLLTRLFLPITWEFGSKHFINPNPNKLANGEDCLFVCITRNIYDWIGGFYKLPHHVNANMLLNLKTFILDNWQSDVPDDDYFTGKPYKNIFELRKSKLEFLYIVLPLIVDNMVIVRYEDLQNNPEDIVTFIAEEYSILKTNNSYSRLTNTIYKPPYHFSSEILSIINEHTCWSTEKYFHYCPK